MKRIIIIGTRNQLKKEINDFYEFNPTIHIKGIEIKKIGLIGILKVAHIEYKLWRGQNLKAISDMKRDVICINIICGGIIFAIIMIGIVIPLSKLLS